MNPSILEFFPRTKKGMKPPWPDEHCEKANLLISIRVTEPDTGPDDEVTAKKTRMNWMDGGWERQSRTLPNVG